MQTPFPSDVLFLLPALKALKESLEAEIELTAELDAKLRETNPPLDSPDDLETTISTNPHDTLHWKTFYEVDEVLRDSGMTVQAERILELYSNTSANAPRTLEYLNLVLAEIGASQVDDTRPPPDGPQEPNLFCWGGEVYGRGKGKFALPDKPFGVVRELWEAPFRCATENELIEEVWEHDEHQIEADHALRGAYDKANRFFRACKIPLRIEKRDRGRIITLKVIPPKEETS